MPFSKRYDTTDISEFGSCWQETRASSTHGDPSVLDRKWASPARSRGKLPPQSAVRYDVICQQRQVGPASQPCNRMHSPRWPALEFLKLKSKDSVDKRSIRHI